VSEPLTGDVTLICLLAWLRWSGRSTVSRQLKLLETYVTMQVLNSTCDVMTWMYPEWVWWCRKRKVRKKHHWTQRAGV